MRSMFDLASFSLILGECLVICNLSDKASNVGPKLFC